MMTAAAHFAKDKRLLRDNLLSVLQLLLLAPLAAGVCVDNGPPSSIAQAIAAGPARIAVATRRRRPGTHVHARGGGGTRWGGGGARYVHVYTRSLASHARCGVS
jgi:hypothetical protein